ncbi:MAG: Mov34/MPN/PAD-1 family protein [Methanomassiliicoccales archaeon]|nr:MAG: Mov34/MPN/PAD-1 family protein [Methanomassiliicoccales archaeon]
MLKRKVWGIYRDVLEMIMEVSRNSYPNEFVALLRHEDGIIDELHFLPGSQAGEESAILPLYMRPIDLSVVGSVHCHPGFSNRPSAEDLSLFQKFGHIHIIMCLPYDMDSWKAYDKDGNEMDLEVVDD